MACGKMAIDGKTWLVVGPSLGDPLNLMDPLNVNQGWLKGIDYFHSKEYFQDWLEFMALKLV